jgi:hypothetical protein
MSSTFPSFRHQLSDARNYARSATPSDGSRIERSLTDSGKIILRPTEALEPKWIAAIDAATD